jgi:hypothetical protein
MTGGKMIGVMLDPARRQVRHERYGWYVDWFAQWGFNTLLLNLADDISCSIELKRYPQLASAHAMGQDEMRALIAHAEKRGMETIPIMPVFGHAGYIFWRDGFRHLRDHQPGDRNALCVTNPESRALIAGILEEIMDLFPSRFVHVGFDETGSHPKQSCRACQEKFAGARSWEVELAHLNWLRELVARRGKRLMIFFIDSSVGARSADMSAHIPKDVACIHWDYERGVESSPMRLCLDRGLDYVGCTAVGSTHVDCFVPNSVTLDNQRIFRERLARRWDHDHLQGIFCALWGNLYTFFDTRVYATAYAADRFRNPAGSPDFSVNFCRFFWGVNDAVPLAKTLEALHAASPVEGAINQFLRLNLDRITDEELQYVKERSAAMATVARALKALRSEVRENLDIFDAYILAADVIAFLGEVAASSALSAAPHGNDRGKLGTLAATARSLAERAWRNWDLGFYEDDIFKREKGRSPQAGGPVDIDRHCHTLEGPKNAFYTIERIARFLEEKLAGP